MPHAMDCSPQGRDEPSFFLKVLIFLACWFLQCAFLHFFNIINVIPESPNLHRGCTFPPWLIAPGSWTSLEVFFLSFHHQYKHQGHQHHPDSLSWWSWWWSARAICFSTLGNTVLVTRWNWPGGQLTNTKYNKYKYKIQHGPSDKIKLTRWATHKQKIQQTQIQNSTRS